MTTNVVVVGMGVCEVGKYAEVMIGSAEDAEDAAGSLVEDTAGSLGEDTVEDTEHSLVDAEHSLGEDAAGRTVLGLADNAVDLDQTAREQLSKSMKLLLEASV